MESKYDTIFSAVLFQAELNFYHFNFPLKSELVVALIYTFKQLQFVLEVLSTQMTQSIFHVHGQCVVFSAVLF